MAEPWVHSHQPFLIKILFAVKVRFVWEICKYATPQLNQVLSRTESNSLSW